MDTHKRVNLLCKLPVWRSERDYGTTVISSGRGKKRLIVELVGSYVIKSCMQVQGVQRMYVCGNQLERAAKEELLLLW